MCLLAPARYLFFAVQCGNQQFSSPGESAVASSDFDTSGSITLGDALEMLRLL